MEEIIYSFILSNLCNLPNFKTFVIQISSKKIYINKNRMERNNCEKPMYPVDNFTPANFINKFHFASIF